MKLNFHWQSLDAKETHSGNIKNQKLPKNITTQKNYHLPCSNQKLPVNMLKHGKTVVTTNLDLLHWGRLCWSLGALQQWHEVDVARGGPLDGPGVLAEAPWSRDNAQGKLFGLGGRDKTQWWATTRLNDKPLHNKPRHNNGPPQDSTTSPNTMSHNMTTSQTQQKATTRLNNEPWYDKPQQDKCNNETIVTTSHNHKTQWWATRCNNKPPLDNKTNMTTRQTQQQDNTTKRYHKTQLWATRWQAPIQWQNLTQWQATMIRRSNVWLNGKWNLDTPILRGNFAPVLVAEGMAQQKWWQHIGMHLEATKNRRNGKDIWACMNWEAGCSVGKCTDRLVCNDSCQEFACYQCWG